MRMMKEKWNRNQIKSDILKDKLDRIVWYRVIRKLGWINAINHCPLTVTDSLFRDDSNCILLVPVLITCYNRRKLMFNIT